MLFGPHVFIIGTPNGPVLFCLRSSVTLPAVGPAGRQARGRSGGRHCTAGQYGYIPLGRHLVLCLLGVIQIRVNTWASARRILTSLSVIVEQLATLELCATSVSILS